MIDAKLATDYVAWGDDRLIQLLGALWDEDYDRDFGELTGSIRRKAAHIVSVYDFFLAILDGDPFDSFPDRSQLSRKELLERWRRVVDDWSARVEATESGLYGLPLAGARRVDVQHIYFDALTRTVHHRGQILTMLRLLGKGADEVHPRDTNLDYLMFLFQEKPGEVHPPA